MDKVIQILLIEDNIADADYLQELLSGQKNPSFSVQTARRLSEGLERLVPATIDAVLLDLGLPDSRGMETLVSVREKSSTVPVIILTGLADEEFALKAIHSGADDYLIKGQITDMLLVRTIRYTIERRQIIEELRRSEQEYRLLFESSPFPLWVYCRESLGFLAVNDAAIEHFGFSRDDFLKMTVKDILEPEEIGRLIMAENEIPGPFRRAGIWKQRKKDGTAIDVDMATHDVTFNGKAARLALPRDVTELKKAEETIKYQAYHDLLTGLPNRAQLMLNLDLEVAQADRNRKKLAVLHIDLDRFRAINESLGHLAGDKVIREVSERLKALIRKSDTLARTGGDEFVILLTDLDRPQDAALFAQLVTQVMGRTVRVNEHELYATASIGISIYPQDSEDAEVLLKYADMAVDAAKKQGRDNYQFFNPADNTRTVERLLLESNLRQSVERRELSVHYQPQISIRTGKILAVEALVRWKHPFLGLLAPARFIPVAEEMGFISSIDEWVMRTACGQQRLWAESGLHVGMTVNISSQQFRQPALLESVSRILRETGVDPRQLELEITESTAMHDIDVAVPKLKGLKEMGVNIAIDDFGTGYSSLNYLKRFPVRKLKIDQSFIRGVPTDPDDQAIVNAVIAMGHKMRLNVIAEGVETDEQLAFLRSNGCDEMQGFLFSEPLPADALTKLLAQK